MNPLQKKIEELTAQFARNKAQEMMRELATRNRQQAQDRKARSRRLYVLGNIVEKMGLDALDDALLIGVLTYGHDLLASGDAGTAAELRQVGSHIQRHSIRKPRLFVDLPPAARGSSPVSTINNNPGETP